MRGDGVVCVVVVAGVVESDVVEMFSEEASGVPGEDFAESFAVGGRDECWIGHWFVGGVVMRWRARVRGIGVLVRLMLWRLVLGGLLGVILAWGGFGMGCFGLGGVRVRRLCRS